MFDGEKFGKAIVAEVKLYVAKSTDPLTQRLADLERRIAEIEKERAA